MFIQVSISFTEFEQPIDSDQDLVDRGQKVYFPEGSPLSFFYQRSPVDNQRLLYAEFAKNKDDLLYSLEKGQEPKSMLDKLLQGAVISRDMQVTLKY